MIDNQALGLLTAQAMEALEKDEDTREGKITNVVMVLEVQKANGSFLTINVPGDPRPSGLVGLLTNGLLAAEGRWGPNEELGPDE